MQAFAQKNSVPSQAAEVLFNLHQTWLKALLPTYSLTLHHRLAQLYLADERFTAYYNSQAGPAAATNLAKIINHYTAR